MSTEPHAHDAIHADHHHDDGDTYYLDQLCMVGMSGTFGALCLAMYVHDMSVTNGSGPLRDLLATKFHPFVLASGVVLTALAAIRAVILWRQTGQPAHSHDHDHDHGACDHDHAHGKCDHHHHEHAGAAHHHHHDHDEADHDHGWAPWRYAVLVLPVAITLLALLGMSLKPMPARGGPMHVDMTQITAGYGGIVGAAANGQVLGSLAALYMTEGTAQEVTFQELEGYGYLPPHRRAEKRGTTVTVRAQFSPAMNNDHLFSLVRFRISCCAADAIEKRVPVITRSPLSERSDLNRGDWIKVTGIVDFYRSGETETTVLRVMNLDKIAKCPPDNNPYIQ